MATSLLRLGRLGSLKCLQQEGWGSLRIPFTSALCTKAEEPKKAAKKAKASSKIVEDERASLLAYKTAVAFPARVSASGLSQGVTQGESEPSASTVAHESQESDDGHSGGVEARGPEETGKPGEASRPAAPPVKEDQDASSSSSSDSESDSDSDSDDEKSDEAKKAEDKTEPRTEETGVEESKKRDAEESSDPETKPTTSLKDAPAPSPDTLQVADLAPTLSGTSSKEIPPETRAEAKPESCTGVLPDQTSSGAVPDVSKPETTAESPEPAPDFTKEEHPEVKKTEDQKNVLQTSSEAIPDVSKPVSESSSEKAPAVPDVAKEENPEIKAEDQRNVSGSVADPEELLDVARVISDAAGASGENGVAAPLQEAAPAPAAPEPFDNTTYKNLQHHSYQIYTFVDMDVEMAKHRLPQPSTGRASPRD